MIEYFFLLLKYMVTLLYKMTHLVIPGDLYHSYWFSCPNTSNGTWVWCNMRLLKLR